MCHERSGGVIWRPPRQVPTPELKQIPAVTLQGRTEPYPLSFSFPVRPQCVYEMHPVILVRAKGSQQPFPGTMEKWGVGAWGRDEGSRK